MYEKVKHALVIAPHLRNSDKQLIWHICFDGVEITHSQFMHAPSFETITRARRAVQKAHPELQADFGVREARARKTKKLNWLF